MAGEKIFAKEALEQGRIVPFHKPAGWTSFDVVNKLRYMTRVKKIGHAGTLDPFATGLLLICFGKATKKAEELVGLDKEYIGTIKLGAETDTLDVTGKVVNVTPIDEKPDEKRIGEILSKYLGEIQQVPPMFSAIKHKGKKLYSLARKGKIVERKPRTITIYDISLQKVENDELSIHVVCSKGTYIRALARDIGRELGWGGYLKSLTRTRIGPYLLKDAWDLKTFEKKFTELFE
jgi:tRNA pseudouridine55 synthase